MKTNGMKAFYSAGGMRPLSTQKQSANGLTQNDHRYQHRNRYDKNIKKRLKYYSNFWISPLFAISVTIVIA